jgi:hypothetical protein
MALSIAEANAISHEYFDKTIRQQVYEGSPFWKKLKADGRLRVEGGTQVQFPIRYQKLDHAREAGWRDKVEYRSRETRTAGILTWKKYDADTAIHHDETLYNSGRQRIINLIKDRSEELSEDLKEKMHNAIFSTSQGSNAIQSLDTIIDSTTAYAGVDPSDASEWAAQEDSSTTTLIIYGANSLSEMVNDSTFGENGPTMHVTTRAGVSKFESIMDPQKIYEDKDMANLGFMNVTFKKKPVVGDVFCPEGYWFGIDMEQFEIVENSAEGGEPSDWFSLEQAGFPNAMAKYVCWVGEILCRMRKTSFKMSNLDFDN